MRAGDEDAEADGGIDVTARNRADAVGHRDDGEAERGRDAQEIDGGGARSHATDGGGAAAEKHQRERSDEFGQRLVHIPVSPTTRKAALLDP